jgi:hypothetical protein
MRLNFVSLGAAKAFRSSLFAILLCCALPGCGGDYCIVGIFSPGGTTNLNPTCPPSKPTGNVTLTFGSPTASESAPVRTPHLFVTLRGVDALATPVPGEDAAVWQELAPELTDRPVQVELTAPDAGFCESGPLGSADVPVGVYRQLRLRLVPNPPAGTAADAPALDESACGANVFSCLILPGATAQPLAWADSADVVISSDRIADGFIRVLPETSVHVSISLDPRSSLALPEGAALRFLPSFSASARSGCAPTD